MRPFHAVVGFMVLALGLVGWATLGQAQPRTGPVPPVLPQPAIPERPAKAAADRPLPETPVAESTARPVPIPASNPVRVIEPIDSSDILVPAVKVPSASPGQPGEPRGRAVKPVVFIPNPEAPEKAPEPQPEPAGPVARQEPAISLEWLGPKVLRVGVPAEYTVTARNMSPIPLHKVIVQVKVPAGAKAVGTEPKAGGTEAVLVWDHDTLAPKQEKTVRLKLMPPATGEMICQAWVTFTGSSALKVQVREPKLTLQVQAPRSVTVGEPADIVVALSNPGDHPANGVKLSLTLGAGLESSGESAASIDVGTVAAGQTREVKIPCVGRTAGKHKCEVTATGEVDLQATGSAMVQVIQPRLDVEVTGPKLRYLDRKAVYAIKVANPGDAAAGEITLTQIVPSGFRFVAAEGDGQFDATSRTVKWVLGEIPAGKAKELKCELVASGAGDFTHTFVARGAAGVRAEKTVETRVEGLSALAMTVTDTDDPVEVGTETTYVVQVSNTGSKDETDVKLVCTIPAQMRLKNVTGPGKYEVVGKEVVFTPLRSLEPQAEVTYKVTVVPQTKGDARFKATLTAGGLSEPVIKQESTRAYAD